MAGVLHIELLKSALELSYKYARITNYLNNFMA